MERFILMDCLFGFIGRSQQVLILYSCGNKSHEFKEETNNENGLFYNPEVYHCDGINFYMTFGGALVEVKDEEEIER